MRRIRINQVYHLLIAVAVVHGAAACGEETNPASDAGPVFEQDIQPLLVEHCGKCHGESQAKAELNLIAADGLLAGGESGPALVPGDPEESLLLEYVRDRTMPPEGEQPLSEQQIELLEAWIEAGAPGTKEAVTKQGVTQHDVLPILHRRCTVCHGAHFREDGVDLRTRAAMLSSRAMIVGDPDASRLVQRVRENLCPPKEDIGEAGIEPMTPAELSVVSAWIAGGSPVVVGRDAIAADGVDPLVSEEDRKFWSFVPPTKPRVPEVEGTDRVRNAIDAFLLSRLEAEGLSFSEEADRLTLLRRLSFDLTGLPPEPEQIERFLEDESPQAYENLVERLLDSPAYGERWARFWLDLAGYSDSEGKRHADLIRPYAWRYRDYVIRAMNDDKPFDQFLVEQIAGDELVDYAAEDAATPDVIEKLVATGFLRMAPDGTSADPVNRVSDRIEVIDDELDVLCRGVLGLTMKCARCHSHKYDPIPQRDYYRLTAVFKGAYDEYNWMTPQPFNNQWKKAQPRHLTVVLPEERAEIEAHNAPLEEKLARLRAEQKAEETEEERKKELKKEITELEGELRELPRIRALWDRGDPSPTWIYRRGDETQPTRPGRCGHSGRPGRGLEFVCG